MQNKIKIKTKDDNIIIGGIFPSNQFHEFFQEMNFTNLFFKIQPVAAVAEP